MPFTLARRGGGLLRNLHISHAASRPTRVAIFQTHVRRISLEPRRTVLRPITRNAPAVCAVPKQLISAFATESEAKEKKTTKASKGTKKTTKKKAVKPKTVKKRGLTEKQKEAKKAREVRQLIKDLKEAALQPPKKAPENFWNLAVISKLAEAEKTHQKGSQAFKAATELAKAIDAQEKQVCPGLPLRCSRIGSVPVADHIL